MKEETFRKVWIKSEEDLPKKNNPFLLAHFKKGNETEEFTFGWYPYKSDMKEIWLRDIDWYLQPISQPEQEQNKPTDSDIECAATDYADSGCNEHHGITFCAYKMGATEMRDNKIFIAPTNGESFTDANLKQIETQSNQEKP